MWVLPLAWHPNFHGSLCLGESVSSQTLLTFRSTAAFVLTRHYCVPHGVWLRVTSAPGALEGYGQTSPLKGTSTNLAAPEIHQAAQQNHPAQWKSKFGASGSFPLCAPFPVPPAPCPPAVSSSPVSALNFILSLPLSFCLACRSPFQIALNSP